MRNSNDDFDIIKSWLEEDLENIELPQSLRSENLMHLIQDIQMDNVEEPTTAKKAKVIPLKFTPLKLATYAASFAIVLLGISQMDSFSIDMGVPETTEMMSSDTDAGGGATTEEATMEFEDYSGTETSSSAMQKAAPRGVSIEIAEEEAEETPMQVETNGAQQVQVQDEDGSMVMYDAVHADADDDEIAEGSREDEPVGYSPAIMEDDKSDDSALIESDLMALPVPSSLTADPNETERINPTTGVDSPYYKLKKSTISENSSEYSLLNDFVLLKSDLEMPMEIENHNLYKYDLTFE